MQNDKALRFNKTIIPVDMSIGDALQILDDAGLGILLICSPDRQLLGVLTDGDIRRYLLRNHNLDVPVSSIMNQDFRSLEENEKHKAYDLLRKSKMNHIPILDNQGRIVDLITSLDFVKAEDRSFDNQVVIIAGGKGDRLLPLTKIIPKPLIPVGDQTMIEMVLENFRSSGFSDFFIIVNYKKQLIKSYFEENKLSQDVTFIDETEYLGTAGGLNLLKGIIDRTFILSNCDVMAKIDYGLMLDWHREHEADLTILGVRKKVNVPYGVISIDADNYVTSLDEKPFYTFMIISGIYIFEPSVLECVPENSFYGMDKLISDVIVSAKKVTCYPIENGWFDIGQFEEYKKVLKHFEALSA